MSTFKRTKSGLNNQHLFHDVDLIVFLEGGSTSYKIEEVYDNKYNSETEDILFWKKIFEKFVATKKIKFKSVGSKTTIKEIALDIINGEIKNVLVAMDNEFEEVLKQRIIHPQVFYTHGYSWENDAWNQTVIKAVIEELTAIKIENNEIESTFNQFLSQIKVGVNADGYLFKKGSSFFPRKTGHLFCIELAKKDLPYVKLESLKSRLIEKSVNLNYANSFGRRNNIDTLKFCFGHLLADYCYQLITHYIKKRHSLTTISKDIINRIGINKFFQLCFNEGSIYNYYELQFESNLG